MKIYGKKSFKGADALTQVYRGLFQGGKKRFFLKEPSPLGFICFFFIFLIKNLVIFDSIVLFFTSGSLPDSSGKNSNLEHITYSQTT